jgi:hypothetical protein
MGGRLTLKLAMGITAILAAAVFSYFFWSKPAENDLVYCTQEAKLCPDGSYVGRTGPRCEFSACPGYAAGVEYKNEDYGFKVSLPDTWAGYGVSADRWTAYAPGDELGEIAAADGPVISIRNPKWTKEAMYQDIPIMIFTRAQWNDLQSGDFHIGVAPMDPTELGANAKYVFALPARYNYGFPPGYEEVEKILDGHPLTAF